MKREERRAKMLQRLAQLRRIERMRAVDDVALAHDERQRLALLDQRSKAMLKDARDDTSAQAGSDLATAMKVRTQLAKLAQSTQELSEHAEKRASDANDRLHAADRKLDIIERRSSAASAALRKDAQDGTAFAENNRKTRQPTSAPRSTP